MIRRRYERVPRADGASRAWRMSATPVLLARVAACATACSRARYLITDFDGTCTATDTTPIVPHLAARASPTPSAVLGRFGQLEDLYLSMLGKCRADFMDGGPPSQQQLGRFDRPGLEAALAAMDAVSDAVTDRVSESGILAGIEEGEVAPALAEWTGAPQPPIRPPALRDGCTETLAAAAADGWRLGVLTLNWCAPLVHAYLPLLRAAQAHVWSNSIDAAGVISSEVNGAAAKRAVIARLVRESRQAEPRGGQEAPADRGAAPPPQVVYIGDSATDLLAMLEADVGILVGNSESTRHIARRFGVRLEPLPLEGDARLPAEGVVWEAGSWEEIRRCLGVPLPAPVDAPAP